MVKYPSPSDETYPFVNFRMARWHDGTNRSFCCHDTVLLYLSF